MSNLRAWVTPLTIGSFLTMGVTGVLMFFHLDSGFNKLVHEWSGWVIIAGVIAHLALNWRPFVTYFKRPLARLLIAAGVTVLAISFWPVQGQGNPMQSVFKAINNANVATVIELSGHDLSTGLARLAKAGFEAQPGVTVSTLTAGKRGPQIQFIEALFSQ